MRIKFYGHSDDCLEIEITKPNGKATKDEWCNSASGDVPHRADIATVGGTRSVRIHAVYDGTWSFAVGKSNTDGDDGHPLPPWTFTVGDEHGYSTSLTVDTGKDVVTVAQVDE